MEEGKDDGVFDKSIGDWEEESKTFLQSFFFGDEPPSLDDRLVKRNVETSFTALPLSSCVGIPPHRQQRRPAAISVPLEYRNQRHPLRAPRLGIWKRRYCMGKAILRPEA